MNIIFLARVIGIFLESVNYLKFREQTNEENKMGVSNILSPIYIECL